MSSSFANERPLGQSDILPLLESMLAQMGSDTWDTKKMLKAAVRGCARGYVSVEPEIEEDLRCQLTVGGQVEDVVVDVAAFSNGKPCMVGVALHNMDAMTSDQIDDIITRCLMAVYAHANWTAEVNMLALVCDQLTQRLYLKPINRQLVDDVARH